MATAHNAVTGFGLTCPYCGEEEPAIALNLNDIGTCKCGSCKSIFVVKGVAEKARDQARRWAAVQEWIEAAGTYLGQDED